MILELFMLPWKPNGRNLTKALSFPFQEQGIDCKIQLAVGVLLGLSLYQTMLSLNEPKKKILKALLEKEKLLVSSIFYHFNYVIYPLQIKRHF